MLMILLHILGVLLILLSPVCMGLPWIPVGGAKSAVSKMCFAYVAGYFLRHTLFHWIAMPMTILGLHFSTMANVFTVALLAICVFSVWKVRDYWRKRVWHRNKWKFDLTRYELVYLIAFAAILAIQVYIMIYMDASDMTFDDATYTVYSSDALASDYMMITDPYTGVYSGITHRFMQSALLFPAFISRLTGMPVTLVDRTFSYTVNLLMAYACYTYMAEDLYQKRDNRILFLLLVSLLYLFGHHSHYSMSFRLLGPNSQGKAILTVILIPLLFVLFRKSMAQGYNRKLGILFLLLSDAACSLSFMGTGYTLCIVVPMTVLSFFGGQKDWRKLFYILWGCALPCLFICVYIYMRYHV